MDLTRLSERLDLACLVGGDEDRYVQLCQKAWQVLGSRSILGAPRATLGSQLRAYKRNSENFCVHDKRGKSKQRNQP